jgi:hypothetical protein
MLCLLIFSVEITEKSGTMANKKRKNAGIRLKV